MPLISWIYIFLGLLPLNQRALIAHTFLLPLCVYARSKPGTPCLLPFLPRGSLQILIVSFDRPRIRCAIIVQYNKFIKRGKYKEEEKKNVKVKIRDAKKNRQMLRQKGESCFARSRQQFIGLKDLKENSSLCMTGRHGWLNRPLTIVLQCENLNSSEVER